MASYDGVRAGGQRGLDTGQLSRDLNIVRGVRDGRPVEQLASQCVFFLRRT
eukprot:COSAG02_NODE_1912_length_10408_cov_8.124551_5_plen_51_part_00